MRTTGRAHVVKHNKASRLPLTFVYVDTEALRIVGDGFETQRFRLAVAACDRRRPGKNDYMDRLWFETMDLGALWDWIEGRTGSRKRTVLVAHNLAYDLRIMDAFHQLPRRGWELTGIRLADRQAWCSWRRDGKSLVCADSLSWFPVSLEKLGALIEIPKCPLPDWEDDDEAWFARCRVDVAILAEGWRRTMAWLFDHDLGNWRPTGAGQSWTAYRHRFMDFPLLVHESDDARLAERVACWGGRCEAWRHGKLRGGPFIEWDFRAAYASIGAECDVPIKLHGELDIRDEKLMARATRRCAVLAEVEVTTDVPVVPARGEHGILWPVGTFTTTLWDNEIHLAEANGAQVRITRAWWYRKEPALRRFCEFCLDLLDPTNVEVDPVVRLVVKHWSRALVGRTAARWSQWKQWGRSPLSDVDLSTLLDINSGERTELLQLGHQLFRRESLAENPDAMVAILSWVSAQARVRLWGVMAAAGFENLAYVDTDSVLVNQAGHQRLREAAISGLAVKSAWASVEVRGPRQIVLDGRLRAAGIPLSAVREGDDRWAGEVWTGLGTSLGAGEADRVTIIPRVFTVKGVDHRREHLPKGRTGPIMVTESGQSSASA